MSWPNGTYAVIFCSERRAGHEREYKAAARLEARVNRHRAIRGIARPEMKPGPA